MQLTSKNRTKAASGNWLSVTVVTSCDNTICHADLIVVTVVTTL
jgi:hypothetical protein